MEKEAAAIEILLPFLIVCFKSSTTFLLTLSRTSGVRGVDDDCGFVGVVFENSPMGLFLNIL